MGIHIQPVLALTGGVIAALVLGGVVVILLLIVIGIYNKLVVGRNRVKNAFAQIDVQLTRRHDLIPNLIETAKGYMKHERETLESVTEARNQAAAAAKAVAGDPTNGSAMKSLMGAEGALSGMLGKLNVTMEAYPDLKASQNMMQVQEELTSTENKIAFSRQAYNDSVMHFNVQRESFPDSIIAGMFNFNEAQMFEIEDEQVREVPKVDFS
ncbi:MAG: LemA family protein [Phycisphaerales bacterium]|jgi:LemA protein|nr:LemA family protein [Phycisphaerales bacterium]